MPPCPTPAGAHEQWDGVTSLFVGVSSLRWCTLEELATCPVCTLFYKLRVKYSYNVQAFKNTRHQRTSRSFDHRLVLWTTTSSMFQGFHVSNASGRFSGSQAAVRLIRWI